jgi:hypothetical protein
VAPERLLVNFFYAYPVGHAVEALHYCLGFHAAAPDREVAVALNTETPVRLARFCPFISAAYAIEHPFLEGVPGLGLPAGGRSAPLGLGHRRRPAPAGLPARDVPGHARLLRGQRRASGRGAGAYEHGRARSVLCAHRQLRFALPEPSRAKAADRMGEGPWIAVMPAGSGDPALYPSAASWSTILDALREALPTVRFAVIAKLRGAHHASRSSIGSWTSSIDQIDDASPPCARTPTTSTDLPVARFPRREKFN